MNIKLQRDIEQALGEIGELRKQFLLALERIEKLESEKTAKKVADRRKEESYV